MSFFSFFDFRLPLRFRLLRKPSAGLIEKVSARTGNEMPQKQEVKCRKNSALRLP